MTELDAATPQAVAPKAAVPRRRWRWLVWSVGVVVVLFGVAWAWVPLAGRSLLEQQATAALGREVRLAAVRFNPLTLALQVDDLSIAGAQPGSQPLLRLKQLHVDATWRSIWHLAPVIEAVQVTAPQLRLMRRIDGQLDIADLLARWAARPADDPQASPAQFALYNLRVADGEITLSDQMRQREHRITALQLGLPFLSNQQAAIEVHVEPRLAFQLNGAPFDTGAQAKPFAQARSARINLRLQDLDITPFLAYLPAGLAARPTAGRLGLDLRVQFAQPPQAAPAVALSGEVLAQDLDFVDARGEPVAAWRRLKLTLADVQPLRQQVLLGDLALEGARIQLQRDASGRMNLAATLPTPEPAAQNAASAVPATAVPPRPVEVGGWRLGLSRLAVEDLQLDWTDQQIRPAVHWRAQGLRLVAQGLAWPLPNPRQPSTWQMSAVMAPTDGAAGAAASLQLTGRLDASGGGASIQGEGLALEWAAPYLAQVLVPRLSGRAAWQAGLTWRGAPAEQLPDLTVSQLRLDDLTLRDAASVRSPGPARADQTALASLRQLVLTDVRLLPQERLLALGRVSLRQPQMTLVRSPDGLFNLQQWLVQPPAGAVATTPMSGRPSADPARVKPVTAPWRVQVRSAVVEAGQLRWQDEATGGAPVHLKVSGLNLSVGDWQWPAVRGAARLQGGLTLADAAPGRPSPDTAATAPTRTAGQLPPGRLQWTGQMSLAPLAWRGQVQAERLPLHAVAPYLGSGLPVAILRAEAGWQGQVEVAQAAAGWTAALQGDARLGDLRLHARQGEGVADDELLSWQTLALQGVQLTVTPGTKPRLAVSQASLTDFFARLVITEQGQLNLTGLAPPAAVAQVPSSAALAATAAVGEAPHAVVAASAAASAPGPAPSPSPSPATAMAAPGVQVTDSGPLDLVVGGVVLSGGRVDFSDRFIRPNYRADLTELQGRLGAFRSDSTDMATLELKGRAAGTALLDVRGSLNPTARPLALDIQARATDLELAPLSPYAGKYAGYAIERGKLSMDVSYRIQADGRLDAKNQVVLNQLTFGERIDSPEATQLPVLLAVALLKDRHGVIDLNLPIGGSVNDPQFSIGGLILKVIFNLLTKAITAPFALLSGGGTEELSFVEFLPGTARLRPAAEPVIAKVAQALSDRPALKMTVTGASDPQSEHDAIQTAQLEARLLAEQRKELMRAGAPPDQPPPALAPAERTRLLARVYADTRLPNKPRNLIGLAKELPAAEMEKLLRAALPVSTDIARELALQRGLAVRDALVAKGLPAERLFLAAPRLRASGEDDAEWTPRVQLSLGTQ